MGQRDFNKDMGSYLRERKTAGEGFFSKMKKKMPKVSFSKEEEQKPIPDTVPKEHVEMVLRGERVPQPEPVEDEFEAAPEKRKPFWHRWFFVVEETYEEPTQDDVDMAVLERKPAPKVDEDVKNMLRTCVRWVNMLPPEKIQEIKRSDDYVEFKRLLDKYGLLKK